MAEQANFALILAFCGESGAGKSTIAKLVKECLEQHGLRAEFATKYISGRKQRESEDPNVRIVDKIPKNCMVGFPREDEEIGYDLRDIEDMLSRGIYPIIISRDLRFLAQISSVFNPEKPVSFEEYHGRKLPIFNPETTTLEEYDGNKLPVVRMRIYDIRSAAMTEAQMEELMKERVSHLKEQEAKKEATFRKIKWEEYYRQRYGSSDILETLTNVKDFEAARKMVEELIVGSAGSDETTILGYESLWKESEESYNAGVILGLYRKLSRGVRQYLQKQEEFDLSKNANCPNLQ